MCRVRSGSCERTFHMRRRSLCAFGVLVFEKPNEYEGLPRPELAATERGKRRQSAKMGSVCIPSEIDSKGEVHEYCCSWR
jgi:hypothetical protein